ncbi:hypothetical protein D9M68_858830 [compost metagenome]
MHQPPCPVRTTQQFARTVGQNLIQVHVGLRARPGLPDHQREFAGVPSGDNFVGSRHDGVRPVGVQRSQRLIHHGTGPLDLGQRTNQLGRHALARDREVRQRALRLCAPQAVCGHFDGAHAVGFDAGC